VNVLDVMNENFRFVESQPYGKNESSICSTVLNSVYPEHPQFFFSGGLLGTTYLPLVD
jgi:hypothetical protein